MSQLKDHKKVIFFIDDAELKRWVTELTRIQHKSGKHLRFIDPLKSMDNKYFELVSD